jgi:hypothetical protein
MYSAISDIGLSLKLVKQIGESKLSVNRDQSVGGKQSPMVSTYVNCIGYRNGAYAGKWMAIITARLTYNFIYFNCRLYN